MKEEHRTYVVRFDAKLGEIYIETNIKKIWRMIYIEHNLRL